MLTIFAHKMKIWLGYNVCPHIVPTYEQFIKLLFRKSLYSYNILYYVIKNKQNQLSKTFSLKVPELQYQHGVYQDESL